MNECYRDIASRRVKVVKLHVVEDEQQGHPENTDDIDEGVYMDTVVGKVDASGMVVETGMAGLRLRQRLR